MPQQESSRREQSRSLFPAKWDLAAAALFLILALIFWWFFREPVGASAEAIKARIAEKRTPNLRDFITTGLFWGGQVSIGILALLALTRRLWVAAIPPGPLPIGPNLGRRFFIPLIAITLLAGAVRYQRLDTSIYADEAYTLQNYVMGKFDIRKAHPPKFEEAGWEQTFFGNKEANNHILFSIASRACLGVWRAVTGAGPREFDETAFRLPSFLAGVASVPLLALLLAGAGLPRSGLVAAFLLVLHPWHIRYSGEARGYALTIFFILLGLLFLQKAFREGAWRHLAGYAACQFGALASFPGVLHLMAPLGVGALIWALAGRDAPRPRWAMLARLTAANAMAAIPFALLYGPSLPQIARYLALDRAKGKIDSLWLSNELGLFTLGMPWRSDNPSNPLLVSVGDLPGAVGFLAPVMAAVILPAFAIWGLGRLAMTSRGAAFLLAGASVVSVVISIGHSAITGAFLYPWYIIHALPGLLAAAAVGIEGTGLLLARSARLPALTHIWSGFVILVFAVVTQMPRSINMRFSREQNREAAIAVRNGAKPGSPEAERIIAATVWSNSPLYDPSIRWAPTPRDLVPLMRQAIAEKRPLYFTYANRAGAERTVSELLKILDDRKLFDFVKVIPGTDEQQFTHYVLALRQGLTIEEMENRLSALGIAPSGD